MRFGFVYSRRLSRGGSIQTIEYRLSLRRLLSHRRWNEPQAAQRAAGGKWLVVAVTIASAGGGRRLTFQGQCGLECIWNRRSLTQSTDDPDQDPAQQT